MRWISLAPLRVWRIHHTYSSTLKLNCGRILSVNRIMEHVWGWDSEAEINVVWVNLSQLRKQLPRLGSSMQIRAVRGAGYTLEEAHD